MPERPKKPVRSNARTSLLRNAGIFVVVLALLVGGTWAAVKVTTDYLLYQDATSTARNWARYVTESVKDLEQIAGGEQPSASSMAFFQGALKAGQVFRYEIFNRHGFSQLISDQSKIALVDLSEYSAMAARAVATMRPIVDVKSGSSSSLPSFFARAFVPVVVDQRPIAVVSAYVDQTEQHDAFYRAFLLAALGLCLLTGLSFAIPAIAWYRRTGEKKQADRHIRFLAHHDALTGLANRPRLTEKLSVALEAVHPGGSSLAVHFIDLDRFKEINDTLGHDGGDFLLKAVAERLRSIARPDDIVARIGGDEFVFIQTGILGQSEAESFAQRIISTLVAPLHFNAHEIVCTASVGVAMAPADGNQPERLLKSADLALYKSKEDGRNCVRFFLPEMDQALAARLKLEKTIRNAVAQERFELHYQPVFETSGRHLMGFEALIRLPDENGTLISPATFIPAAEEMRLIDKIGAWVLREACRSAATWPEHLTVAVNLSPAQFAAGNVSRIVADALGQTGLAPQRLELEITESLLLGDNQAIMVELRALKAMGVAIVMDDFGTGYSSLSYLWRFPFDKIKIDRSFMQAFDGVERDAQTVVKTIIALGRELHMSVTVEGVETAEQAAFLDDLHADQVQGFYFGRPGPSTDVAAEIISDIRRGNGTRRPQPLQVRTGSTSREAEYAA